MDLTHSQHSVDFDNRPLDASRIRKIQLTQSSQEDESLWVMRFYDPDDQVLGSWLYRDDQQRRGDLLQVMKINPLIIMF